MAEPSTSTVARSRSLESRLREHYDALPTSERKIADLMLDFPSEVAAYSGTELAGLAGSSKAAVTRVRFADRPFGPIRR